MPWRRWPGRTTKQVTTQVASPASERQFGEARTRGYDARGAVAHQPAGSPSSYAITPGGGSSYSWARRESRRLSGSASDQALPRRRKYWHQQLLGSPRTPNTASTSGQRSGVAGVTSIVTHSTVRRNAPRGRGGAAG